jgi:hypothetical protein
LARLLCLDGPEVFDAEATDIETCAVTLQFDHDRVAGSEGRVAVGLVDVITVAAA